MLHTITIIIIIIKIIIALRQYQLLVSTRREEISAEYTHKNIATCICTYKNVPVKVKLPCLLM